MVKRNSKKITIIISALVLFFSAHGISNKVANMASLVVGALSAGTSYKAWNDIPDLQMIHPAFFVGTPLVATGMMYRFFHSITPAGRIKRANVFLNKLLRHKLAKVSFDNDSDFFDAIYKADRNKVVLVKAAN